MVKKAKKYGHKRVAKVTGRMPHQTRFVKSEMFSRKALTSMVKRGRKKYSVAQRRVIGAATPPAPAQ